MSEAKLAKVQFRGERRGHLVASSRVESELLAQALIEKAGRSQLFQDSKKLGLTSGRIAQHTTRDLQKP
jgi:hypothetical protein